MRRSPVAPRAGAHPTDEALASLLDDEEAAATTAAAAALRAHVAGCLVCTRRLAALRAVRRWLREGAETEAEPSRDLARLALVRLRQRQVAVGSANEVLATLATFLRWLAVLFSAPSPRPGPEPSGEAAGGSRA
jgi:hypothetical protein